jgi:hypothetical protein
MDRPLDRRARAGANPEVVRRVAAILAERWDPAGELAAPGGARTPEAHAAAVLGIIAAGGRPTEVVGYLRRAEEDAYVLPRSTGAARRALAEAIEAVVLETPAAGDGPHA